MNRYVLSLIFAVICVLVLLPAGSAHAQTETPTPTATPTPKSQLAVTLSSGNELVISRSVTYGDIAIVIVVLILWMTFLLSKMVEIPKEFLKR